MKKKTIFEKRRHRTVPVKRFLTIVIWRKIIGFKWTWTLSHLSINILKRRDKKFVTYTAYTHVLELIRNVHKCTKKMAEHFKRLKFFMHVLSFYPSPSGFSLNLIICGLNNEGLKHLKYLKCLNWKENSNKMFFFLQVASCNHNTFQFIPDRWHLNNITA